MNNLDDDLSKMEAENRECGAVLLDQLGIDFERLNRGAHLIINAREMVIDFWPGTGKWSNRKGKKGQGIKSLINYINLLARH